MIYRTSRRVRPSITSPLSSQKIGGRNVFIYNSGDGPKYINRLTEWMKVTDNDVLRFKNIRKENLRLEFIGLNLKISIASNPADHVIISNFSISKRPLTLKNSFSKIEVDGYTLPINSITPQKILSGVELEWLPSEPEPVATPLISQKIDGSNVFIYQRGDGYKSMQGSEWSDKITDNDMLIFKGISKADLSFSDVNQHLKITISGTEPSQLIIRNFFSANDHSGITNSFSKIKVDGYTLPTNSIKKEKVSSGVEPEWLPSEPVPVSTQLIPQQIDGSNIFIYQRGDGYKSMSSSTLGRRRSKNAVIKFDKGITKDDLSFSDVNDDLKITVSGGKNNKQTDQLIIEGIFNNIRGLAYTDSFKKIEVAGYTLSRDSIDKGALSNTEIKWEPVVPPEITTSLTTQIGSQSIALVDQLANSASTLSDREGFSPPICYTPCTDQIIMCSTLQPSYCIS